MEYVNDCDWDCGVVLLGQRMPKSASQFSNFTGPRPKKARLSARKAGYDAVWQRFREHIANIRPPICVHCGIALPGRHMHLDHKKAIDGINDPGRLDEDNVQWLCLPCHTKKTVKEDGAGWRNG